MSESLKMRMSFTGIERIALDELDDIEALAMSSPDYDEDRHETYSIRACISAYRDTLLSICRQETNLRDVKDFWFHGEDPKAIPYHGDVINFEKTENSNG